MDPKNLSPKKFVNQNNKWPQIMNRLLYPVFLFHRTSFLVQSVMFASDIWRGEENLVGVKLSPTSSVHILLGSSKFYFNLHYTILKWFSTNIRKHKVFFEWCFNFFITCEQKFLLQLMPVVIIRCNCNKFHFLKSYKHVCKYVLGLFYVFADTFFI